MICTCCEEDDLKGRAASSRSVSQTSAPSRPLTRANKRNTQSERVGPRVYFRTTSLEYITAATMASTNGTSTEKSYFEQQRELLVGDVAASLENVLQNMNRLNRSLEGVIAVRLNTKH